MIMANVSTTRFQQQLRPGRDAHLARIHEQIMASRAQPLGADEQRDLQRIREQRKLARDLYWDLAKHWGSLVLVRLGAAEQTHLNTLDTLLDHYGLSDPVAGHAVGESGDPKFQALHVQIVEVGHRSEMAASQAGLLVEEMSLSDLAAARARTRQPEIAAVYDDLLRNSRNHLRALFRQMQRFEGEYVPQSLSLSDFEAIVWTQPEPC